MDIKKAMELLNIPEGTGIEKMLRIARQNVFFEDKEQSSDCIIMYCKQAMNEQNRQERQEQKTKELEVYYM